MKKLLLLLLIAPMIGFGQKFEASLNLPVSSVINIKGGDFAVYNNEGLFVPQGKIFHLVGIMTNTLTNPMTIGTILFFQLMTVIQNKNSIELMLAMCFLKTLISVYPMIIGTIPYSHLLSTTLMHKI
jgi:hypothetical protein